MPARIASGNDAQLLMTKARFSSATSSVGKWWARPGVTSRNPLSFQSLRRRGDGLLNRYTAKAVSGVRIPPSPFQGRQKTTGAGKTLPGKVVAFPSFPEAFRFMTAD